MAVVSVSKLGAGRSSSGKAGGTTYKVVFQVIVNSAHDGPGTVVNASGIPDPYSQYSGYETSFSDPYALCVSLDPEQDGEHWQKWRVTATFDTNWNSSNQQSPNNTPEDDPPLFWIETEFVNKKVTKEWNGTEIKNSAGELLDGLERLDCLETWVWERNYISLNREAWKAYQNTVNSVAIGEIEPKQALLHIIVPKPSYRNGVQYWRVQFREKVKKDKWTVNPADRGTSVKNSSGKLERPMDDLQHPHDGEVFLDGTGKWKRDTTAAIVYLGDKNLYEPKNHMDLGFIS